MKFLFKFTFILFAALIAGSVAQLDLQAQTSTFGVSPAYLYNDILLPGSSYTQVFHASRGDASRDQEIHVTIEAGEATEWITSMSGEQILFPKGQTELSIPILVDIPIGSVLDRYEGNIWIRVASSNSEAQVEALPGVSVKINLLVGEEYVSDLEVLQTEYQDSQEGDFESYLDIMLNNLGNTPSAISKVDVAVYDLSMILVGQYSVDSGFKSLDGFTQESITIDTGELGLFRGDYLATVTIYDRNDEIYSDRVSLTVDSSAGVLGTFVNDSVGWLTGTYNIFINFGIFMIFLAIILVPSYIVWEKKFKNRKKSI